MNSNPGGQSSSDLRRKTASALARKKVLEAYANMAAKTERHTTENAHLKDQATSPKINSESWKKYHSAWQDYYRRYYSNYYSKAAQDFIAKERQKSEQGTVEDTPAVDSFESRLKRLNMATEFNSNISAEASPLDRIKIIGKELRQRIRAKAEEQAMKTRRHRKFFPIIAGVCVVLLVLFLQYNRLIFAPIMAYVSPGNAPAAGIEAIDPTITQTVSPDPRLIIPKLNIDVPVHFGISLNEVMAAMSNGVAHYRISGASAYPGEIGNFVITGHSAGDVYSSNPYKYIFSGLERLDNGDLIYVNYNSTRYTYRVVKKEVVEPTNVAALTVDTNKPILTLVTCTPLGTSRYRLLVTAEQISPSTETTSEAEQAPPVASESDSLPANEPTFFDGFWGFLTGH